MTEMKRVQSMDVQEGKLIKKGSIKKKIESFRRWSSASIKRPPKPKAKTLSLSSPDGDPEDLWLPEGDKRKLRPIVASVFGQEHTHQLSHGEKHPCQSNSQANVDEGTFRSA
ncbi:hypothetical protein CRENBAI_009017 [Crenichthys baileyi]|uniref:Uncharacterized protein n=1 Tax=Crenichthys baileyi TaxID=28760 RepID=A0AAV9RUQ8_9TELE